MWSCVTRALPLGGWRCGVSARLRGVQYREGVADALFEDVVGELPVGKGAGELQCPDHHGVDAEADQAGGSGGIRTPGTSRYARFQVAGEPCAGVCPRLATCGVTCDSSGSAWGTQQSVATRLLHPDAQSISPAALSRTAGAVAGLVAAGDQLGRPWTD
jgi:hypothetical protein